VLGLLLGAGLGAAPWHFLLGTPAGSACLSVGVGLQLAGLAWTDRLANGALAAA
jgi:tight adherence protein B